ncbi:hypothetical protein MKQ70_14350 [Chitinophaga sedimenti]|uniref:hypothetical protein n=1 Tax=Chitinophaga sedimenti TaxID=2033606 RepID=UPI002004C304|nr:hypothetical protein [Chitinophaga sedimenti]MCK7556133.1 hypothetical protein [Chitinophaga sedimenti]
MKKLSLSFLLLTTGMAAYAQTYNAGSVMQQRGTLYSTSINDATENGFYSILYQNEHISSLLTFNPGGSTGAFQMEAMYWGQLRFRNRVDNDVNARTAWRDIWHSGNFTPGNYLSAIPNVDINDAAGAARFIFSHGASAPSTTYIRGYGDRPVVFRKGDNTDVVIIGGTGNVGIGAEPHATHKLAVAGSLIATKIKVSNQPWADFVFAKNYELPCIAEVEAYIKAHQHLPGIPSEAEVQEQGIDVGDMNARLLQKIEEQMLYIIQLKKEIDELKLKVK